MAGICYHFYFSDMQLDMSVLYETAVEKNSNQRYLVEQEKYFIISVTHGMHDKVAEHHPIRFIGFRLFVQTWAAEQTIFVYIHSIIWLII